MVEEEGKDGRRIIEEGEVVEKEGEVVEEGEGVEKEGEVVEEGGRKKRSSSKILG